MSTLPVLLTLVALLAALRGARPCDKNTEMAVTTTKKNSNREILHIPIIDTKIVLTYGEDDVTLLCRAASTVTNLTILNQDGLQAEKQNSSKIQLALNPDVGQHTYYCTDSNNCNSSLSVTVHPAVAVESSNIHQALGIYDRSVYFVPRGENYDVYCSAKDVETLSLTHFSDEELETKPVNRTTVVATVNVTEEKSYVCGKEGVNNYFKVIVDYKPEAREFNCILHLNRKLECSWISSSKRNTFALFILRSYIKRPLCSDMSGAITASCARAWNEELDDLYVFSEKLSLQLEACNEVLCENQKFEINIKSIIKVDPVYNLKLLNTSSQSAEISWRHSSLLCYRNCDYKIKYRLGTQWREHASPVACYDFSRDVFCKLQIALPCPNAHYEVRVYVKPRSANESWSDPASMLLFNTPSHFEEEAPSCGGFMEQEQTPTSPSAVLNDVRLLVSELNLSVKQKMAEINALLDTLERVL